MSSQQQSDEKLLVYQCQCNPNSDEKPSFLHAETKYSWVSFWSERIALVEYESSDEFWNFTALDLLTNESKQIRFHRNDKLHFVVDFLSLNDKFGFVTKSSLYGFTTHFVELDWAASEFRVIDGFQSDRQVSWISVDKLKTGKFVLRYHTNNGGYNHQFCELKEGKFKLGETYQTATWFDFYSKDQLISFNRNFHQSRVTTYNWITKEEKVFEIDASLFGYSQGDYPIEWVNDRLYIIIRCHRTGNYRLSWTDLENKRWTFSDFGTNLNIKKLEFYHGNLILNAMKIKDIGEKRLRTAVKIYNISMRRPNSLRQSAWLLVVKIMKKNGETDPYKAAKEFLPLNSDLQAPWFEDKEQNQLEKN